MSTKRQEVEMIASAAKRLNGITIEIIGTWLWITGHTKQHRKELKELGLKYSSKKEAWYFYSGTFRKRSRREYDLPEIRTMFFSQHKKVEIDA